MKLPSIFESITCLAIGFTIGALPGCIEHKPPQVNVNADIGIGGRRLIDPAHCRCCKGSRCRCGRHCDCRCER